MMDVHLSSVMDHTYEDIEGHLYNGKKSNSDTDLLRLCGQELEIINHLIKGHKRPSVEPHDVTFNLYGHIEQGFYKCHDSIYDVPEGQRIPDLMKKRPTLLDQQSKKAAAETKQKRRLSLDSGHGTSVADDTDSHRSSLLLETSFSSSMPSLCSKAEAKANDHQQLEELNMSDALDRICGTSSLESLPGYRKCANTPPPPLPPRLPAALLVPPPPPLPPSTKKNSFMDVPKGQVPKGKQLDNKRKAGLFKNPALKKKSRLSTPSKLTPVKLLLAASPFFCRRTPRPGLGGVAAATTPKTTKLESSEERRMNLESLKETQIYGLPIIPFPYSESRLKAANAQRRNLHERLIATEYNSKTRPAKAFIKDSVINRKLNFDEEELDSPQFKSLQPTVSAAESEEKAKHCRSCTCNQAIVSRREMLTRLDLVDSTLCLQQQTKVSNSSSWRNNNYEGGLQEDYVKMSGAKLV